MIVDIHTHLGVDRVFDCVMTEENILTTMKKNRIDVSIVQPNFGTVEMESMKANHDQIYKMTQEYTGKIFGMATVNPHVSKKAYKEEISRCIKDLGFVGIKLHPFAQACAPNSKDGYMVAETAAELNVPLMIHTGSGIPQSLPTNVIEVAKKIPDTKFILAHSGMIITAGEAMLAAEMCPNIYLGVSWTVPGTIESFVKKFGSERVLFESDEYLNTSAELAKIKYLDFPEQDYNNIMGNNAINIYKLSV